MSKTKEKQSVVKISDFFTAEPAEQGSEMPITLPGESESRCSLVIRGANSEVFRRARDKAASMSSQLASQQGKISSDEYVKKKEENLSWLIAHCIKEWPFEEKLTISSAQEFLMKAPQVLDQINSFAAEEANFLEANLKKPSAR